jgi:hypothetical protein
MFDLEARIQQWRRRLADALAGRTEAVDELEGHLREEVQRLIEAGRPPEQAWEAALARLGSPEQLAAEFGKVAPPRPAPWLPARVVLLALAGLAILLAGVVLAWLQSGRMGALLACHVFTVVAGYSATFGVGALAVWSLLSRAAVGWDARRAEALRSAAWRLSVAALALTAVGVLLGGVWAQEHLGRFWGWDLREIGGLSVLAWNALLAVWLWRRSSGGRTAMLLGALGNIVVCLSWFGPALAAQGHSYGQGGLVAGVFGFVALQLVLLTAALVPEGWLTRQRA